MTVWDPAQYEKFKAWRDRPAWELMAQIPGDLAPRDIWDLGCGTGDHMAELAHRYPGATVRGLDSSPEMLTEARGRHPGIDFVEADIAGFQPETPPDLIFSNSTLHWLPGLPRLIPRLVGTLAEGGVFAAQVPLSWNSKWYQALRETVAMPRWNSRLQGVGAVKAGMAKPEAWFEWLAPVCASVDVWNTTYLHVLEGEDPVVDWMRGAGLRPYLSALESEKDQLAFVADYAGRVGRDFPRRPDGTTLLPFPRLFVVARR